MVLLGSGIWATILHMPILAALWETSYGQVILVKIGLLLAAMLLGAVNLVRTKPRLVAARAHPELGAGGSSLAAQARSASRRCWSTGAVFAAARALEPRPAAAGARRGGSGARQGRAGPGRRDGAQGRATRSQVLVNPNKAAAPNSFALKITKNGAPVSGADVTLTFRCSTWRWGTRSTS